MSFASLTRVKEQSKFSRFRKQSGSMIDEKDLNHDL